MTWQVHVIGNARKSLRRFPKKDRERIMAVLRELEMNPYFGDLGKIGGESSAWRRRVGDYRIVYDVGVQSKLVEVREIKRRTSNTY